MSNNPRQLALKVLVDINKKDAYSNIELNKIGKGLDPRDENLIRELVYGVIENRLYLDHVITKASKIRLKKLHPHILDIVRMGLYQIIFMDRIPDSAAVNESVKLAKKYGHRGSVGYVNGILRAIIRDKDRFTHIDKEDMVSYISIKYSHPEWMVKRWIGEFGLDFTESLCKANNERPLLNVRVNSLKISRQDLKARLEEKGMTLKEGQYARDCLIIQEAQNITGLQEFKEGLFTIQDESSMLVGQIMDPREGSTLLDVCSAPGGKATHMAQIMGNKGLVISRDIYQHKLSLIRENSKRLGIDILKVENHDALERDEELVGKVDYLLIDAPCSGLGLIRRKPEIKWQRREEDIAALSRLQYDIISNVKDYIRLGGNLVYSTCTIEKDENINLIKRFLEENPNFKLVSLENSLDHKDKLANLKDGYLELYPHIHGTDGFFIAKMIKER
ncbi:MAG: 16S rRNA (cytosine(967)-C(5))-methyltransferase RsmB [Tissierellaceae bacterium]|jgi:16S rRNA (cytosine967-C5)-methyltransferase|nr:16S rRNA (cytosine(967)-C(5))-methyltransferase RsmB [Tissierellia bacterium]